MPHQTLKTRLARSAAVAGFALLALGTAAAAQGQNEIMRSLTGDPAARANQIIQMEIPIPDQGGYSQPSTGGSGGYTSQTIQLDYSRSIDLPIFFPFDRAEITPQAQYALNELGQALINPALYGQRFLIAGHTDAKGSNAYNQILSERRALSVKNYLTYQFGIEPWRLIAVGFGETRLANPAAPHDGINRRVEVTVIAQ